MFFFLFPCYLICFNLLSSFVIILNFVVWQIVNNIVNGLNPGVLVVRIVWSSGWV